MRELLGGISALCAGVALLLGYCVWSSLESYKRGYADGYKQGRTDADSWWIETEAQADQARQEIWRKLP